MKRSELLRTAIVEGAICYSAGLRGLDARLVISAIQAVSRAASWVVQAHGLDWVKMLIEGVWLLKSVVSRAFARIIVTQPIFYAQTVEKAPSALSPSLRQAQSLAAETVPSIWDFLNSLRVVFKNLTRGSYKPRVFCVNLRRIFHYTLCYDVYYHNDSRRENKVYPKLYKEIKSNQSEENGSYNAFISKQRR